MTGLGGSSSGHKLGPKVSAMHQSFHSDINQKKIYAIPGIEPGTFRVRTRSSPSEPYNTIAIHQPTACNTVQPRRCHCVCGGGGGEEWAPSRNRTPRFLTTAPSHPRGGMCRPLLGRVHDSYRHDSTKVHGTTPAPHDGSLPDPGYGTAPSVFVVAVSD